MKPLRPRLARAPFCALLAASLGLAACERSAPAGASPAIAGTQSGGATGTPSVAAAAAPSSGALMPRNDLPGLTNFAKVSDVLYRGAQPTAEGFKTLASLGVKTVVSLRWLHSDRDLLAGTGLRYFRIEAKAWHPEDEDMSRALKIIEDPKNQPVFVHCQHGSDRTGTLVAAYRIVDQGWTREDAASELPNFGYHPIWTEVLTYLKRFDRAAMRATIDATAMPKLDLVE
jgi:protein tyrosine phosphatase (PTP) superfamily phosphohydrolase (DUF442 family)